MGRRPQRSKYGFEPRSIHAGARPEPV
ncbi:uncharacterized protein METZ01_LOCUS206292, partial [marine metagenome]